jgi:hypothetical protein
MKLLLPPKYLCRKMYKLFNKFYKLEKNNEYGISALNQQFFNQGIEIFCKYYEIDIPIIKFKKKIDEQNALGECTEKGKINLLCPNIFYERKKKEDLSCDYVGLIYHELGHYYLWSDAEIKALEFELKMLKRK